MNYSVDDYKINVIKDDDGSYVARVMEFKHLIGCGDTTKEAVEEAKGNLDFALRYLRDRGDYIPVPFSKRRERHAKMHEQCQINSIPMYNFGGLNINGRLSA